MPRVRATARRAVQSARILSSAPAASPSRPAAAAGYLLGAPTDRTVPPYAQLEACPDETRHNKLPYYTCQAKHNPLEGGDRHGNHLGLNHHRTGGGRIPPPTRTAPPPGDHTPTSDQREHTDARKRAPPHLPLGDPADRTKSTDRSFPPAVTVRGTRRLIETTTGGTPMSSYTTKNLMEIDDSAADSDSGMEARFARKHLDSEHLGVSYFRWGADVRSRFGHSHREQEEAYVVVSGSGRLKLDDEIIELRKWDVVRVAPGVIRAFEGGSEGLEVIAVGADRPEGGDGVMAKEWWTD